MSAHTKHRQILTGPWLLAIGWFAAIVGIVVWLARTPEGYLKQQLRYGQFWMLETQFLLLLVLSWINVPALLRSLALKWSDVRLPVAASVLAFALAAFVAPNTSRIYFDEQIYQGVGQNLTDLHLAQMCNDGTVEYGALTCWSGEYNKEPYAYPYLLSVAYRLTGVHEPVAFLLNTVVAGALAWVVFLVTTMLTSSAQAGGYAALVMALMPEQLRWAHTAAAEPSAALACACAVLTALAFVRLRSNASLLWMVVVSVFALQFRPECLLVAPLVIAVCVVYAPEEFRHRRLWWAGLLALLLCTLHLGHQVAVRHEGWGTTGSRMSAAYFVSNLRVNGWFYFGDARFPLVYSLLGLAAVAMWRRGRAIAIGLVYFAMFWGIFLFFYAGSYNFGADDRFSLMTFPPLAILAGIGIWNLTGRPGTRAWLQRPGRLVSAGLVAQFLWYVPFVRGVGEEAWAARADVSFARSLARDLPGNSIVLTQNPHMFHVWGRNAAQLSMATQDKDYAARVLGPRYAGGVFLHWNFWCNVADPVQQSFCTAALDRFPHTLIRERRERDYRYALYQLDVSSAHQSPSQ
jgi:hypothetical protein